MTKPINFVVRGTPVSCQSKGLALRDWKRKIASVARSRVPFSTPAGEVAISITHYYTFMPRCDTDNVCKPICDALSKIVYDDDHQLVERIARRVPLARKFRLWGMPRELAMALCEGREFVFIQIKCLDREALWSMSRRVAWLWAS